MFLKGTVRYISTWLIASMVILLGFARRAKAKALRGDYILSIYFHKPSLKEFDNCVKWLKKNNFTFLSTKDLHDIIQKRIPFPKGAVVLTVDDGWRSNKTNIVDVAEKQSIPVTLFVATDPVEKGAFWWSYVEEARKRKMTALSVNQLKNAPNEERLELINELHSKISLPREAMTVKQVVLISKSTWITIGSHTVSHPILNNCNSDHVFHELELSKIRLQEWIGKEIEYFAYPNGNYSEQEIKILQAQGYKLAFTVRPDYLTPNQLQYKYELPRFEVIENASFAETICRMLGIWEPLMHRVRSIFTGQSRLGKHQTLANSGNRETVSRINFL